MRDIYIDFRSYEDFMNLFHMDIEKSYSLSIIINFPKNETLSKAHEHYCYRYHHELNTEIRQNKRD